MAYESIDNLPENVKNKLAPDAQPLFLAAFNSASEDGLSDDAATQVAWNSLRPNYFEGGDGVWRRKEEGGTGADMQALATDPQS